jgi:hypothetical protein
MKLFELEMSGFARCCALDYGAVTARVALHARRDSSQQFFRSPTEIAATATLAAEAKRQAV